MKNKGLFIAIPLIAVLLGVAGIYYVFFMPRAADIDARIPEPELAAVASKAAAGILEKGTGKASAETASWTQFLGKDRSNIALSETGLLSSFPKNGPEVLWRAATGEGYAGAVVSGGRVFFLDYDQEKKMDAARCLSLTDGKEIWRYSYKVKVKRNHGMSRTTPATDGKFLVTFGPMCQVVCLKNSTGELVWKKDLAQEYGSVVPPWYAGQCPLIDGKDVILAPAGKEILLERVELATGKRKWAVKNPGGMDMTHSSVMPVSFNGKKYFIYCASAGSVLVSADSGEVKWVDDTWKINIANVPSPIQAGPDRILYTGGYDAGAKLIKLSETAGRVSFKDVFKVKAGIFGSQQSTPIFYDGFAYGVIQSGNLACLDLEKGAQVWKSDKKFGLAPLIIADGKIYVIDDMRGILYIVEAKPGGYKELGSAKVFNGREIWSPIALAGGKLIAKDLTELVCVKVK